MANDGGGTTRGGIGNEIFEQVERLIADEGLSRTQAFQRLSEMTGRRAGTVAANYYRVARQRGATLQPRKRRGAAKTRRPAGRRSSGGSAEAALGRAIEALQELSAVVRQQDKEIATLRDQAARVKSALGRST